MKTFACSLCFLLLTLLCFEAVGADKEKDQDKKKRPYASAAADCDKAISGKKSSLAESYSSEVWTLKQRFQKDGDLEKALAADKEWSRSIRREPLTPDDLVESPKELRMLQDAYVERQDGVEQEVAADVVRELDREAKELAQAGNLTDGRVLQQEIDKIKRLYLSDPNTKAKRSAKNESKAAAGKNNPEDPIAACEEAIRQKRVAIQAQYVGELEALEKSFQAKGALEDLFAAKGERKRFMETPLLAEENLVETPDALLELQQQYLTLQQNVATSVVDEFIARLEQQTQALTIDGKLEEALAARNATNRLRQKFLERTYRWITNPANGHRYALTLIRYWGAQDDRPNVNQPDWFDAEREAVKCSGHLVTINDAAENRWLVSTFGADSQFFIGLTDHGSEGNWRWISGEPVTFVTWWSGQPDNGGSVYPGEDVAHINPAPHQPATQGQWNDAGNDRYRGHVGFSFPIYGIIEVAPKK